MKRKLLFVILMGLSTAAQFAKADVSVDFFYDNLSGGNWVEVGDYGYCWQPDIAVNSSDWRPYSDGYWAYTDEGWTWVSYEDFGWATYHYGRWANLSDAGWVWVPGRDQDLEWGPAWVSWRTGGDYIGWAPLPPTGERIYEGRDINGHVDIDFDIGPAYYNFVETRYIGEPVLRERIFAPAQNITYINQTVNVTNITYKNKVVYNYGPDINVINQRASRPIQRLTIQRDNNADFAAMARSGGLKTKVQGQSLVVAAPSHISRSNAQMTPRAVKTRVAKANLDTGWAGVGDARAKEQFKQKLRNEDPTRIPQGSGVAVSGQPARAALPAGSNTNVQAGTAPTHASPVGSAAAGTNVRKGQDGKRNQDGGAAAANATPVVTTSPVPSGVARPTDANSNLERSKRNNRQRELNATGSTTRSSPVTDTATGSIPDTTGQGQGRHNERRGAQLPSSSAATGAETTAPATGFQSTTVPDGVRQGGGNHDRRGQNAPAASAEGQLQGQSPTGADQNLRQGGDRRERRLERQGQSVRSAPAFPDAVAPASGGERARGEGQGQQAASVQPPVDAGAGGETQGQGRRDGGGKRNKVEASPVPSPQ